MVSIVLFSLVYFFDDVLVQITFLFVLLTEMTVNNDQILRDFCYNYLSFAFIVKETDRRFMTDLYPSEKQMSKLNCKGRVTKSGIDK